MSKLLQVGFVLHWFFLVHVIRLKTLYFRQSAIKRTIIYKWFQNENVRQQCKFLTGLLNRYEKNIFYEIKLRVFQLENAYIPKEKLMPWNDIFNIHLTNISCQYVCELIFFSTNCTSKVLKLYRKHALIMDLDLPCSFDNLLRTSRWHDREVKS